MVVDIQYHKYNFDYHLLHLDYKFHKHIDMMNYNHNHNLDQDILQINKYYKDKIFEILNIYLT
jgi:hypothetical protein